MRPLFIWLLFLLVSFPHEAGAFLGIGDATISWDEDVLTKDGQILVVHRTVTHGKDSRWGSGILKEQSISFSFDGHNVKWINNDIWPISYMPDILDIVNGIPVLVMPVHRWGPCEKYGFPPEGLAAFGYKNGHWARIAVTDLPKDLKVNLLRTTHDIRYCKSDIGEKVAPSYKLKREKGSNWGAPEQGVTISEASKYYNDFKTTEDSCARIHPVPNPQFDALKQRNIAVEQNAKTINATLVSVDTSPEKVSKEAFTKSKGRWTGQGYLNNSCNGIVISVDGIREYFDQGAWHLVGFQLNLANDNKIPLQQTNLKKFQAPAVLQFITCEENVIYTIKRENKENLLISRFAYSGEPIDASRIFLPETEKMPGNKWGDIWSMAKKNDQFSVVLADYTYETPRQGGTITQKQTYVFKLP